MNTKLNGFSRPDLLALLAGLLLLALLLAPAHGKTAAAHRVTLCLVNVRDLVAATSAFAQDHSGSLPDNASDRLGLMDWCGSTWLDVSPSPQNWDHETYTKRGQLWPYIGNVAAFTCPEDPARVRASSGPEAGTWVPRIRSYSMNNWFGGSAWAGAGQWQVFTNLSQVLDPANLWILMDERAESINDGFFAVDMSGYPSSPAQMRLVDFPAYYHARGASIGFADGHAQVRVWRDNRTVPPPTTGLILGVAQPSNPDILWLQARSTRLKP